MKEWAMKHWFLTFLLAGTAINSIGGIVVAVVAPKPQNTDALTKAINQP